MSCSGVLGAVSVGNVLVTRGNSCSLFASEVRGSIVVEPGSRIHLVVGTRVLGNVEARRGAGVRADFASIDGNLACDGCFVEGLNMTPIGGNLKIARTVDGTAIFGTRIGGNLEIVESTGTAFVFLLTGSTIAGDVKIEKTTGLGLFAGGNSIRGNVQIAKSGEHRLLENLIGGNVQVVENTGVFPTEIARNIIAGTLQCEKNVPPPIGGFNSARDKQGQCSDL